MTKPTPGGEKPPAAGGDDDEKQASKLVKLAKSYKASGLAKSAITKLQTCVKKYPGTKSAAEAELLLAQWKVAAGS